jgi:hypothetical protein
MNDHILNLLFSQTIVFVMQANGGSYGSFATKVAQIRIYDFS